MTAISNIILEMTKESKVIIVISGKRKSGKDYVTNDIVKEIFESFCHIMRVASPIKKHFCQKYNMNYEEMMTSSQYKEKRRAEMIKWGEEQRLKDVSIFCRSEKDIALETKKPVWILSDARRPSDVEYFRNYAKENGHQFFAIRVSANEKTRENRGWIFTKDVDDVDSECALDEYKNWDFSFENSEGSNILLEIKVLVDKIKNHLFSQ